MQNKRLAQALEKLGLSSLAIQVYQSLLSYPQITVSEICLNTGQYRAKIYEVFEELKQLNLIERHNDFSRDILVKSPNSVFSLLKQRQFEINHSIVELQAELPYILANISHSQKDLSMRVFEGTNKFSYLMTTILDECIEGEEMLSFNENDDIYNVIGSHYFFNVWVEKRIQKKIFNRILLNKNNTFIKSEKPLDAVKYRQSKILQNKGVEQGSYWVIGKKLILWDTMTPKAVLIENRMMSEVIKNSFDIIWNSTK